MTPVLSQIRRTPPIRWMNDQRSIIYQKIPCIIYPPTRYLQNCAARADLIEEGHDDPGAEELPPGVLTAEVRLWLISPRSAKMTPMLR
jgi:hypothetical protein